MRNSYCIIAPRRLSLVRHDTFAPKMQLTMSRERLTNADEDEDAELTRARGTGVHSLMEK
jgi:hypothetical protein